MLRLMTVVVACVMLAGCITLYPEYMTNSCIGVACGCAGGGKQPDSTDKESHYHQLDKALGLDK